MRIAICDDDKSVLMQLSDTVGGLLERGDELQAFEATELLYEAHERAPFDAVILDIEMPGINGIDIGWELKRLYPHTYIVYVTRFPNFAMEAFRVRAFHYLLKPVSPTDLSWVLEDIREGYASLAPGTLEIESREIHAYEKLSDILYMESFLHKLTLHTRLRSHTFPGRLGDYEEALAGKGFYRVHRSYLVNLAHVKSIRGRKVWVDDSGPIPIGDNRKLGELYAALSKWRREHL